MTSPTQSRMHVTPLTCYDEGHEHLVEDAAFHDGCGSGYASALCGHRVHIGPAVAPVGSCCQRCQRYRAARESLPSLTQRLEQPARHRRPSWLARMLGDAA